MSNVLRHIFITGGTGFFGRSLLRYLQKLTHHETFRVTILSRNPNQFLTAYPEFTDNKFITLKKGEYKIENLPWGEKFTHFLHAATDSTLDLNLLPSNDLINV